MPPRRAAHTKMLWLKRESISHSKNLLLGFEKASNNKRHKPRFSLHWSLIFFDATRARGENENELTRRKRIRFRTVARTDENVNLRTRLREPSNYCEADYLSSPSDTSPFIIHGLDATRNLSPILPSLDCTGTGFDKRCADSAFDGLLMVALKTMEAARFYDDTTASLAPSNSR